jgi:osmotically-inducible protein OsmY
MTKNFVRTLLGTFFAFVLVCCPLSASTRSAHAQSLAGHVTDAQLQSTISAKLAKSKIGKDGFKFHVQKGVVTWEGTTDVMQHKGSATRMARSAGATQVVNNIKIRGGKEVGGSSLKKASVSE